MKLNGDVVYRLVIVASLAFYSLYFVLRSKLQLTFERPFPIQEEKFTIRVNTFRRNDLLAAFLDHYTTCARVEVVQVVWSDQQNQPPPHLVALYPNSKVVYETHTTDRLSNRFKALLPPPTRGVLSIDDDLLISCEQLHQGFNIWTANEHALVGYSPRMHGVNPVSGDDRYLRWQNTWWMGVYSIALTKASFMHKRYLQDFFDVLPADFIADIDKHRNCEDLAMAYVVAVVGRAPPVWVQAVVHETADFGISTGTSHFDDRSACLTQIRKLKLNVSAGLEAAGHVNPGELPLIPSYQKAIPLSATWDWIRLSQGGVK